MLCTSSSVLPIESVSRSCVTANNQCIQLHLTKHLRRSRPCLHALQPLTAVATTAAAARPRHLVTLQEYDDFELLWLEYRHELSVSKETALWTLEDVQMGLLPCDADLLRDRAEQFTALSQQIRKLDSRRLLNTSRFLLAYDSGYVQEAIMKLLQLLPRSVSSNPTQLVLDTAADFDLPPEVVALQYQELGMLFQTSLGSNITHKPFHYLMQRLRQKQQQLQDINEGDQAVQRRAVDSAFRQVLETSAGVSEQLQTLQQLLGRELAHSAVQHTPELLDASAAQVQANLQWLQHQLRLSPVAAMLLAEQSGDVLLQPGAQLEQNYSNVCYLLQQLVGWRLQQVHSLLCNTPQLLVTDSQKLANNWQRIQRLSKKRLAWLKELAAADGPLLTAVLSCNRRQLLMLQYAADTGDLQRKGLLQILRMHYADFLRACPGFRTWRSMSPYRWRIVEGVGSSKGSSSQAGAGASSVGSGMARPEHSRDASFVKNVQQQADAADGSRDRPHKPFRKVLAVDQLNRPILIQVGELGPYDRLA